MRPFTSVILIMALSPAASADSGTFEVVAALSHLPSSKPCRGRQLVEVTARYRIEQLVGGALAANVAAHKDLLVVHTCPELPRALPYGRGNAKPLKVGQRLSLRLKPREDGARRGRDDRTIDPFPRRLTRYSALNTDTAPPHAQIIVVVSGGGGTLHRLEFSQDAVTVGQDADSDVMLDDARVARRHLRLLMRGAQIVVEPVSRRLPTRINGRPLIRLQPITHQDRIVVGPYLLKVSLLTAEYLSDRR